MIIFNKTQLFQETKYKLEEDFEQDAIQYGNMVFGDNCIIINAKRKLSSKSLGGTIPDAFLFDMTDSESPEFYLIEVELATHDFYRHIFPQITKFFAFYNSSSSRRELTDKIFSIINEDSELKKQFKKFIGAKEIYKTIQDSIENSQNILLIIDGDKSELPEIIDTYVDTWGKMVKVMIVRKFECKDQCLFVVDPEFENLEIALEATDQKVDISKKTDISEEYHLDGINVNVKEAYLKIKKKLLQQFPSLTLNPQKYYISVRTTRNIAYFKFRKKHLEIVVMMPEEDIREKIKHNEVKTLSSGVQGFYNGPCARVKILDEKNLSEVVELLADTIDYNTNKE
jgi:predicted transport protein